MTFFSKVYILSFFSPSNSKGNAHVLNDHLTQGKSHYVSVKRTYVDPQPVPGEKQTRPCRNHALLGLSDSCVNLSPANVITCLSARRVFPAKMAAAHLFSFLVLLQQHILSLFRDKSLNMLQSLLCLQGGLWAEDTK